MNLGSRFTGFFICLVLVACKDEIIIPADDDILQGGSTTVFGDYVTIFQQPCANLSGDLIEAHRKSDLAFGDIFVTAPATINYGLGPIFNQNSCESCHLSNGRSPFPDNNQNLRGLLLRISIEGTSSVGGPLGVPGFGTQLQTKSVIGIPKEADLTWEEIKCIERYVDGQEIELRHFSFQISNPYTPLPSGVLISPRIAPPVIGLGLLEAIDENDILQYADPFDMDGDGISGKTNEVWNFETNTTAIGRFGWKAGQPTLLQQTAAAYQNDMGITNPLFTYEHCEGQPQCDSLSDDPEVDLATLEAATFYPQSLAVPARRNADDENVKNGKRHFYNIGCTDCHRASYTTGIHPQHSFLSHQVIHPYTDLLLHDMGEGLADHRPDYKADGNEWRTPPLWGIGLTYTVGAHRNFLHDGRARNLEEAIMWHGGEAQKSKEKFKRLTAEERKELISFLESL